MNKLKLERKIRNKAFKEWAIKVKERNGQEAVLVNCRRLWHWDGAASLSQLATEGTKNPSNCKFTVTVPQMTVIGVIEIIPCSDVAINAINIVPIWKL